MENEKKTDCDCKEEAMRRVSLTGTARPSSVMKLIEDEERELDKCRLEKKRNLKKEN